MHYPNPLSSKGQSRYKGRRMPEGSRPLDLLFLGSGNAFAANGRAFSSFLLDDRYLFDCGPTVLQQLGKAGIRTDDIQVVFISHFHADHFFGLPFLFLDGRYSGRTKPLTIVGPPGIEERTRHLVSLAYSHVIDEAKFEQRYVEVQDGFLSPVGDLTVSAAQVVHVPDLECFAFRAERDDRSVVYSGDTTLCDSLLCLSKDADVIVVECSCRENKVHLSPSGIEVISQQSPGAKVIVTHLDGHDHPHAFNGLLVAEDLKRFSL
jgi:ribonuclease BN (tRNA processing enzyme)